MRVKKRFARPVFKITFFMGKLLSRQGMVKFFTYFCRLI